MTDIRGKFGTQERKMPYEDRSIDWSDASINQGTPRIANNHLKERHGMDSPSVYKKELTLLTP